MVRLGGGTLLAGFGCLKERWGDDLNDREPTRGAMPTRPFIDLSARTTAIVLGGALAGAATGALLRARRRHRSRLPVLSLADTLGLIADVPLPVLAKGVIIRRKAAVRLAEATGVEARAIKRLQGLHEKCGPGPLLLRIPGRPRAVLLEPAHLERVLADSPEPFATASELKKSALRHFEPHGALISHGAERAERRRFNEEVLESRCPVHSLADRLAAVVREEASDLLACREFGWSEFSKCWFRVVRRMVLGDRARNDLDFQQLIDGLREDANWGFLKPRRDARREEFLERLRAYLRRAEPGSLAALAAAQPKDGRTRPEHQFGQYLFAYDPAGMSTIRALALLAAHREEIRRATAEADAAGGDTQAELPHLRAAVLEALRLWPTTPLILRQTTRPTHWESGTMPAGTELAIYAPFFHRDERRLPFAHRFEPGLWLKDPPAGGWPLVPFSGGPGVCPARHLVLQTGSRFLAELLTAREVRLGEPRRLPPEELPATLDPYPALRSLTARPAGGGCNGACLAAQGHTRQTVACPPAASATGLRTGGTVSEWSGRQDSNLRPSAPKADALPGCATPRPVRSDHALAAAVGPAGFEPAT
jgi:cytochrome P450